MIERQLTAVCDRRDERVCLEKRKKKWRSRESWMNNKLTRACLFENGTSAPWRRGHHEFADSTSKHPTISRTRLLLLKRLSCNHNRLPPTLSSQTQLLSQICTSSSTRYSASQRGSHSGDQDGKSALPVQSPSRDPFPRCYATLPSGHDALHGHLVLAQHAVRFDRSEMERTREGETWYLLSVLSNVLTITRISQTMPVREHSPCSQWRLGCSYPRMLRKKPCSITVSCAVHWRSLHTRLSCSQDSPPEEVFQLVRVWKNYSTSSETMISDLPSKG